MFFYQKLIDRSTLRQGFQIPVEYHYLLKGMPGGMPIHGETRNIIPAISKHLKNIYEQGELTEERTVSKMEIVRMEGKRQVKRETVFYNLDAVISVGYRVNSYETTQFRI